MRAVRYSLPLLLIALAVASGCRREEKPPPQRAPVVEPIVPEPAVGGASGATTPAWWGDLPEATMSAEVGERVWAALPDKHSGMVILQVLTVDALEEHGATLIDNMGQKWHNVAPALIHPLGNPKRLKRGKLALCYAHTAPGVLARVEKVQRGHVVVQYDWSGETKQTVVEHAEPPITSVAPLAFVGYPRLAGLAKGLVIAASEERAWLRTGSGHVEVFPRAELTELSIRSAPYQVGDEIQAFSWTGGFERGTISRIVEPRLRYAVELQSRSESPTYFFADIIPAN